MASWGPETLAVNLCGPRMVFPRTLPSTLTTLISLYPSLLSVNFTGFPPQPNRFGAFVTQKSGCCGAGESIFTNCLKFGLKCGMAFYIEIRATSNSCLALAMSAKLDFSARALMVSRLVVESFWHL